MKKQYTRYRIALLIGLLGFNTLSACVNTKKSLGQMGQSVHDNNQSINLKEQGSKDPEGNAVVKGSPIISGVKTACCLFGAGCGVIGGITVTMLTLVSLSGLALDMLNPSNSLDLDIDHDIGLHTYAMPAHRDKSPLYNRNIALSIDKAIQDGKAKWARNDTEDHIKDSMFLDDQIMQDLIAHRFSKERVQHLLAKGININATNQQGASMLMGTALIGGSDDVAFALDKGADPNAQTTNGFTSLLAAFARINDGMSRRACSRLAQIIDQLIHKGADPYKEGLCFKSPQSYLECLYDKHQSNPIRGFVEKILKKINSAQGCLAR